MTGDWTWLLYAAFACMLGRGWFIARRPKKPLPDDSSLERFTADMADFGRAMATDGGDLRELRAQVIGRLDATLAFDALVPLLHEAAERLLGEDYIAGSIGRVEAGWGSQHVVALAALQSKSKEDA